MLDLIQSSGHTLQTLLSDILDLARVESGRLEIADEAFDLASAVNDAAQLYAAPASEQGSAVLRRDRARGPRSGRGATSCG